MTRILVIDSYDSFVYNLVQYLGTLGADPIVVRNDEISIEDAIELNPDGVLLSPGPGRPETAGIICEATRQFATRRTPVIGVCLGHQAIGYSFGASIIHAPELMHGKTSPIRHDRAGVFSGLPTPLTATRYHSLVIDPAEVPDELEVTAQTDDGTIMGVRHRTLPIEGIQFHPESILTENGLMILENFVQQTQAMV